MRRFLFIAVMSIAASLARADGRSVADLTHPFSTPDEAAIYALRQVPAITRLHERGGVVFAWQGHYWFTSPAGGNNGYSPGDLHFLIPRGAKIVALYHTHPVGPLSTMLSPEDVQLANDKNWVSYVGMFQSNAIVRYVPHVTPTYKIAAEVGTAARVIVSDGVKIADFTS